MYVEDTSRSRHPGRGYIQVGDTSREGIHKGWGYIQDTSAAPLCARMTQRITACTWSGSSAIFPLPCEARPDFCDTHLSCKKGITDLHLHRAHYPNESMCMLLSTYRWLHRLNTCLWVPQACGDESLREREPCWRRVTWRIHNHLDTPNEWQQVPEGQGWRVESRCFHGIFWKLPEHSTY